MRKLFFGRRRYALACLLATGGLLAAACEPLKPEPVKPEAPTGLSIQPTGHDFGNRGIGDGASDPFTFTVTNNGPGATGTLDVLLNHVHPNHFVIDSDLCGGLTVADGEDCTVDVQFDPSTTGVKVANLVVDDPDDGGITADLVGTALEP